MMQFAKREGDDVNDAVEQEKDMIPEQEKRAVGVIEMTSYRWL